MSGNPSCEFGRVLQHEQQGGMPFAARVVVPERAHLVILLLN